MFIHNKLYISASSVANSVQLLRFQARVTSHKANFGLPRGVASASTGYTFVEVLVALSLFAILAAFAIPRVGTTLSHQRVNRAASVMVGELQYAQQLAARLRQPVVVSMQSGVWAIDVTDQADDSVYRTVHFGESSAYKLDQMVQIPGYLTVFPNGVGSGTNRIELWLRGYKRTVVFSRAGQIRIL